MNSKSTIVETNVLIDFIKSKQKNKITLQDLPRLVLETMIIAQKMRHLKGKEKKKLVTKAITLCIDRSDIAGPFEGIVLQIVPKLCDTLIDVDKGRLVINQKFSGCPCLPFK